VITAVLAPFDVVATAAGFTVLQRAIDLYGYYQGLVGAARRSWAHDDGAKVVSAYRSVGSLLVK
jgi:hypothetical protein